MLRLSVVIIGRNEGQRLTNCIKSAKSIRGLSPQEVEIIYVDSNSTDDSVARAQALGVKVLQVKPERPAAAIGRNAGWRAATAPLVLFLDGDTLLEPDFVSLALPQFDNHKIAVVCGQRRERYPFASVYQRVLDLDWIKPSGMVEACGGDAIIRRLVLQKTGGYDESLIAGEEPEMCQRIRALGFKIYRLDTEITTHDLAISHFSQYWRRAVRSGYAYAEVSNRLKNTATPLWIKEAKHNFKIAGIVSGLILLGLLGSFLFTSFLPLLLVLFILVNLSGRIAWRARWKSSNYLTLALYGVHSLLQHIPIAVGQLSYYWHQWRGTRQQLIEYK